ncbi:MAG: peptidase C13 [Lysobacter sp.]|nr:peptidase C13 [Lysobacter sp.]
MTAPDAQPFSDRPEAHAAPVRRRRGPRGPELWQAAVLCLVFALCGALQASARETAASPAVRERDRQLLEDTLAKLAPQRPGVPDLYVVGFAGDSEENVFRNEVRYLETLMTQRFGAQDRVVALINHRDSLMTAPRPLATLDNLRATLAGVAKRMDPEQDVLLLFMTMHGTPGHELLVQMAPRYIDLIDPDELREALDDAGVRNRVLVISACYSGGFVSKLESDDTLILTASRKNRPSFGCGSESDATYFGRAWLVEGLNETTDFVAAFEGARTRIAAREKAEDFKPSFPQIDIGANIQARLQAWQTQLRPGPTLAYPYRSDASNTSNATAEASKNSVRTNNDAATPASRSPNKKRDATPD